MQIETAIAQSSVIVEQIYARFLKSECNEFSEYFIKNIFIWKKFFLCFFRSWIFQPNQVWSLQKVQEVFLGVFRDDSNKKNQKINKQTNKQTNKQFLDWPYLSQIKSDPYETLRKSSRRYPKMIHIRNKQKINKKQANKQRNKYF